MAIHKDEIFPQGITLLYHRILNFDVDLPNVRVTLAGYLNKDLRDQEKLRDEKQAALDALQAQITEAQSESGFDLEADNPELAELGDQFNLLTSELEALGTEKLYLKTVDYAIVIPGEATRQAIYDELMLLPKFADALEI